MQTSIYGGGHIADLDELERQITERIRAIPVSMLENVMDAWPKRLQKCIDINGKQGRILCHIDL